MSYWLDEQMGFFLAYQYMGTFELVIAKNEMIIQKTCIFFSFPSYQM